MKPSIPQIKNYVRRGLYSVVDKDLSKHEKQEIIREFENRCAYCGEEVSSPQFDHVVPGKGNGRFNRVLSCVFCNSYGKLDRDWKEFLINICKTRNEMDKYQERFSRIADWTAKNRYKENADLAKTINGMAADIGKAIAVKAKRLKKGGVILKK